MYRKSGHQPTMLTDCFIQETCPWFFEMRDLIDERPNVVPSGLGNGSSEMDCQSSQTVQELRVTVMMSTGWRALLLHDGV
jgi:hypothetical protein